MFSKVQIDLKSFLLYLVVFTCFYGQVQAFVSCSGVLAERSKKITDILSFDKNGMVNYRGRRIKLSHNQYKLVKDMYTNPYRAYSVIEMYEVVHGEEVTDDDNFILHEDWARIFITRLRKKFKDVDPNSPFFYSILGYRAYRFIDKPVFEYDSDEYFIFNDVKISKDYTKTFYKGEWIPLSPKHAELVEIIVRRPNIKRFLSDMRDVFPDLAEFQNMYNAYSKIRMRFEHYDKNFDHIKTSKHESSVVWRLDK